jgi:hypothetical protein
MQPWVWPDLFPADLLERLRTIVRLEPGLVLTVLRDERGHDRPA